MKPYALLYLPQSVAATEGKSVELLEKVLEAHGGLKQWSKFGGVEATIRSGGQLWDLKGMPQDDAPRQMRVSLRREWSSVRPYGSPTRRTEFSGRRIAILDDNQGVVSERLDPAEHAEGKDLTAAWDPLDRAYFNGYALWTYLNVPFLFIWPGVQIREVSPWHEQDDIWPGLRVTFPSDIVTHSREQDFYFGVDGLLKRHDYRVEASGAFDAAQYVSDYIDVQGLKFPTTRRAYMRDADLRPMLHRLMVSIDLSDFRMSQPDFA